MLRVLDAQPQPMTSSDSGTSDDRFDRRVELVTEAVGLYHQNLVRYVFTMTKQWQDAENLIQELWRYVVVHFREEKILEFSLLRRKAYHLFIDHYRSVQRKPLVLTEDVPEETAPKVNQQEFTSESEQRIKDHFFELFPDLELTKAQKEALWLHARYGFTIKEIQSKTGTAASTVGDWIALGRKRIAEALNNQPHRLK